MPETAPLSFRICQLWAALPRETSLCFSTEFCKGNEFLAAKKSDYTVPIIGTPPERQLTMIPGASFGPSCHEIQYQPLLNGTKVLQISARPPKGCTCHKTQTKCTQTLTTKGQFITRQETILFMLLTKFHLISYKWPKVTAIEALKQDIALPLKMNQNKLHRLGIKAKIRVPSSHTSSR